MESNLAGPSWVEDVQTIGLSKSTCRYVPRDIILHDHKAIHYSSVCNSEKMEPTQMTTDRKMAKLWYIQISGIQQLKKINLILTLKGMALKKQC